MKLGTLLALLAVAPWLGGLNAATLAYQQPYSYSLSNLGLSKSTNDSLSFSQFDSSLGTLQSVQLEDVFNVTATANIDAGIGCGYVYSFVTATFTGISSFSGGAHQEIGWPFLNCVTHSGSSSQDYDLSVTLTGTDVSPYIGSGQVSLPVSFGVVIAGQEGGGAVTDTSTVTYTYDPDTHQSDPAAPEPSTFAYAAGGGALVWLSRRRRRSGALVAANRNRT